MFFLYSLFYLSSLHLWKGREESQCSGDKHNWWWKKDFHFNELPPSPTTLEHCWHPCITPCAAALSSGPHQADLCRIGFLGMTDPIKNIPVCVWFSYLIGSSSSSWQIKICKVLGIWYWSKLRLGGMKPGIRKIRVLVKTFKCRITSHYINARQEFPVGLTSAKL